MGDESNLPVLAEPKLDQPRGLLFHSSLYLKDSEAGVLRRSRGNGRGAGLARPTYAATAGTALIIFLEC